jgi:hypothetical protein
MSHSLCQSRLLGWNITPFLDDRFLHLPGVGSGPGTHLLWNIHTLLSRGQLGHQLGHMLAGTLGLQGTLLPGGILDNSLGFVIAFFLALEEVGFNKKNLLKNLQNKCQICRNATFGLSYSGCVTRNQN